jgi:hypothetical protein
VCALCVLQTGYSGSPEMASPVSPQYNAFEPPLAVRTPPDRGVARLSAPTPPPLAELSCGVGGGRRLVVAWRGPRSCRWQATALARRAWLAPAPTPPPTISRSPSLPRSLPPFPVSLSLSRSLSLTPRSTRTHSGCRVRRRRLPAGAVRRGREYAQRRGCGGGRRRGSRRPPLAAGVGKLPAGPVRRRALGSWCAGSSVGGHAGDGGAQVHGQPGAHTGLSCDGEHRLGLSFPSGPVPFPSPAGSLRVSLGRVEGGAQFAASISRVALIEGLFEGLFEQEIEEAEYHSSHSS